MRVKMRELLRDCWRLFWHQDSESAMLVMIGLVYRLSDKHLQEFRDLCDSLLWSRRQ